MIDDLYSAKLLKLAANMPRTGRLPKPDASVEKVAKLCGSRVVIEERATARRADDLTRAVLTMNAFHRVLLEPEPRPQSDRLVN